MKLNCKLNKIRVIQFPRSVGSFPDYPFHHLKGAFVLVQLPEPVNGVKNVTAVNGEAISHPTAESRANGFSFGESLDSPRQGILVLCRLSTEQFQGKSTTRCSTY
ncbi:hypothetical protein V8G54_026649 [Vigna mungo]|uniref:Uncharacterized protein n=1 Tax=Vigna mungo TaxID=3915 RepID=A0AAQ3N0X7_VIGMU